MKTEKETIKFIEGLRFHKGEGGREEKWDCITFEILLKKLREFYSKPQ